MGLTIGILLGLFSLVVLALPFLRKERAGGLHTDNTGTAGDLREKRISIYHEIRTLENDLNLGQVSPQDYERRLQDYRLRAAKLLMEEEEMQQVDLELEEEINLRRNNGRNSKQDHA